MKCLIVFLAIIAVVFGLPLFLWYLDQKRKVTKRPGNDPLDNSPLIDPVDLLIYGPYGDITVKVNRVNAEKYRQSGLESFPEFGLLEAAPDFSFFYCFFEEGFRWVDSFFLYQLLFGSNQPDRPALIESWKKNNELERASSTSNDNGTRDNF